MADSEPPPRILFEAGKPYRRALPGEGRAHADRPLPFLILSGSGDRDGLAARVAATSPAYVLGQHGEAIEEAAAIARADLERFPRLLLISLYDLPEDRALHEEAPRLAEFKAHLGVGDDPAAVAARDALAAALAKIEVDLRTCQVEHLDRARELPGIAALLARDERLAHLSVGLPQNYRVPGGKGIYPQLLHDLIVGVFDALLHAACAFQGAIGSPTPASHRALGRASFVDAARQADAKLFRIASSFDFLLGVSPINNAEAYERFRAARFAKPPAFRYRPLEVDPDAAKRALYAIDLRRVEDPVLETIFAEKRREIDLQLTMLATRNLPGFRYASLMLYGAVEAELLAEARGVLASLPKLRGESGAAIGAVEVRDAAKQLMARYRETNERFDAKVLVRPDIAAGLMVSGHKLMIAADTTMPRERLDALLQHEVSVHVLTCVNGAAQGLKIFQSGLAGYEGVQEGLGVFAEAASGGLTRARLRLLAARVLVVDAMIQGADFIAAFRLLHDEHGFGAKIAFNIVSRVYRSGGFAKDAIYLRGFREVIDWLRRGRSLTPFWYGKIASGHADVVEELSARGLLRAPKSLPEFLERPETPARIEAMRAADALWRLV